MLKALNVEEYISGYPDETRHILQRVRECIQKAAPEAEEIISYGMPAYRFNGILVYFAGMKNHTGFYPTGSGIEAFKDEFAGYNWSKGAVQFPYNKPLPVDLIERMVRFRLNENLLKKRTK